MYICMCCLSFIQRATTHHRSEASDVWNQITRDKQQQLEARYIAKQMARGSWENHPKKKDWQTGLFSHRSIGSIPFFFIDSAWLLFFFYLYSLFLQSVAPSSCPFQSTSTWLNILPCAAVVGVCVRLSRTLPMGEDPCSNRPQNRQGSCVQTFICLVSIYTVV